TIPGPGFAYALAGIAEAWQDSAPLVHIVQAPPEGRHPRLRPQALDQAAIVRPMVKAVFGVTELAQLGEIICTAFETAHCGEPGPGGVELGGPGGQPGRVGGHRGGPGGRPDSFGDAPPANAAAARAIWARIHQARKPVLLL